MEPDRVFRSILTIVEVECTGRFVNTETVEILMSFKGLGRETDTGLSVS